MKFSCRQENLSEAVLKTQRAVSIKSNIPTLEGIMIKTKTDSIELCGYDLEIGIKTSVPAQIEKDGAIVINARLFSDIVRKLPNEEVFISLDENLITTINCGYCKFSVVGIPADDYPELPEFSNTKELYIAQSTLKSMIKQTIFAVAETDTKPVHTGTLFEIQDKTITLVSVDGYRFAMRKENIDTELTESFVVPGKTLSEVLKLIPDTEDKMQIFIGDRHITFNLETCSIISRLLDGEFLEYKSAVPTSSTTTVKVKTREIISSLERVSLLITDKLKSPVCCLFSEDKINLSCTTAIGKGTDQLPESVIGDKIEICFNSKYLLDALKNTEGDEIKMEMNNSLSPLKITPLEGDAFIFLVLPVRLSAITN